MGGGLLSLNMGGLKSRHLKTRFQMYSGPLPLWGMGKSAGLREILFANLLLP